MVAPRRLQVLLLAWLSSSCLAVDVTTCEESTLLQVEGRRVLSASDEVEVEYVVSRGQIETDAPGLAYRVSMDFDDRDPSDSLATWGSTVPGVAIGMDWLKVGTLYLPMRVAGHRVLERVASSDAAALSVIRQQPEDRDDAEVAVDGEDEATETEAVEPEAAEPAAIGSEATEPEAAEPEAVEPEAAEPEAQDVPARRRGGVHPEAETSSETSSEDAEAPAALEPEVFNGVVVEFGVIFRSFPFMDFKASTYTASLAFTQRWPADAERYDAAAVGDGENLWSPNLIVTNHDITGLEVISTTTSLNQTSGMFTQVDYLTLRARQTFNLKNFPFDTQVLSVRVTPASPGGVAMKLVPVQIPGEPTLDPTILEDHGFRLSPVADEAGAATEDLAEPSRGTVEVALERRASAYFSSLFLPALLLLAMCWSVFFLPLPDSSIAVPRAALSVTAFLALFVFMAHVEQLVPVRYNRMWIDVFTENVAVLVSAAVAFNTLEHYVHSQMKLPVLTSQFSRELRIVYPSLSVFVLSLLVCATCGETLTMLSVVCRIVQAVTILGYMGSAYARALFCDESKLRRPMSSLPPR